MMDNVMTSDDLMTCHLSRISIAPSVTRPGPASLRGGDLNPRSPMPGNNGIKDTDVNFLNCWSLTDECDGQTHKQHPNPNIGQHVEPLLPGLGGGYHGLQGAGGQRLSQGRCLDMVIT